MASSNTILERFNSGLFDLRELFYESGRLEDSNTKLDEITKLLCLELVSIKDPGSQVPSLSMIIDEDDSNIINTLNDALYLASRSKYLLNYDGTSFVGPNPKFNMTNTESNLARSLINVVIDSFNGYLRHDEDDDTFELINEAFGHFVRDTFRQNIEDAQYMTPPEAVQFMVDIGISHLMKRGYSIEKPPVVCDPSCGVGSFLAHFYKKWIHTDSGLPRPRLVGQDKVDRMARLSVLNLSLFNIDDYVISRGNSLQPGSPLDKYENQCDMILTNPPFGARYACSDLAFHSSEYFPLMHNYIHSHSGYIDSEILFIDRYFSLLKPGGILLAVVPDSIVSASGISAYIRDEIEKRWWIHSITELPPVAFAQAGTRTRTSIIEVEKIPSKNTVILSTARSIGFEVSVKKGVPYKKYTGNNDLVDISEAILKNTGDDKVLDGYTVLNEEPSSVCVTQNMIRDEGWTPSHYSANRIRTLSTINKLQKDDIYTVKMLDEIAKPAPKLRRNLSQDYNEDNKCISVLHIGDFGSLNIRELEEYVPKTPGRPCQAGDILFSKINPRIPRVLVVPELPYELTCSLEFEVLRPKNSYTAHEIMLLLLGEYAQNQIQSLTSGTSSSHNRIKTRELFSIRLAIPKNGTMERNRYDEIVEKFRIANLELNSSNKSLKESWHEINTLLKL